LEKNKIATIDHPASKRDWKQVLPGLVISAITLAAVFYIADIGEMLNALRLANYGLVAAAFTLSFAWLAVRAVVWRTLLQDKAAYSPVFFTICEGYLLNNLLPFRMGELARAFLLSQKARLDFWSVLSSIVIERVLDLAIAAGLLLSTLPFVLGATWARTGAVAAAGIVAAGLGVLFLLARNPRQFVDLFMRVTKPWPGIGQALGSRLDAFLSGLSVLNDGRRFLKAVAWVIVNWAVVVLQYYILLRAFFPQARLLWGAFSLGVGALGIAAPSSPGAIGVLEFSLAGALALFGLNYSTAVAFALTAHLFNYISNGILGGYALARDGETLTDIYRRVRNLPKKRADK
jgi:uncharacterized protein (TIRG00374 family)